MQARFVWKRACRDRRRRDRRCHLQGPSTVTDHSLPQGLHPETLAVREAVERSQWGEHSEALYLASSFVQPNAETAARRFAGQEEG